MARVIDRDNGYRKRLAGLDKAKDGFKVTVGVHAEEGAAPDGDVTVVQVTEWLEFGTETQPPRPAITAWADERGEAATRELIEETRKAVKAGVSPAQRADQLAQKFAGEIQSKIAAGIPPPNAESTVRQKGSSTPWIDTGQVRSSIRGKVVAK